MEGVRSGGGREGNEWNEVRVYGGKDKMREGKGTGGEGNLREEEEEGNEGKHQCCAA